MKKTMGSENQNCTNCSGGFSNSAVDIEGLLRGDRSKYINYLNPEVCISGVSKKT